MATYTTTDTELTSVANAIRTKGGTSTQLAYPAGFVSAIGDIPQTTATPLSVTENGTYTAPSGTAYSPVTVEVSGGGGSTTSVTVTKPSRMMPAMYVYYSAADGTYSRTVLSGEPGMPGSMTDDMLSGSLLVLALTASGYQHTSCTVTGATAVEGFGTGNPSVGVYKVN